MTDMFTFNFSTLAQPTLHVQLYYWNKRTKTCLATPVQSELADTDTLM